MQNPHVVTRPMSYRNKIDYMNTIYIYTGKRLEVPRSAVELELEKDLEMTFVHFVLQRFVVCMEHDNTLNGFNTWTTYLGHVVRGFN